jgi:hypothetical protein
MRQTYCSFWIILLTLIVPLLSAQAQKSLLSALGEDTGVARSTAKQLQFHLDLAERVIEIYWEMPIEINVTGYEIQRSINGNDFKSIAWIGAVGNAQVGGKYLHLDQQSFINEQLSYRLKISYEDGQQSFSETQIIDLQLVRSFIEFSPIAGILPKTISFNNKDIDVTRSIQLLDTKGKVLQTYKIGVFKTEINLSNYENGVYFINIPMLHGSQRIERLVKQ